MPSDNSWSTVDYTFIADKIDYIIREFKGNTSPGLEQIVSDYAKLLRRHVVEDEALKEECRIIYARHKKALDLIFKHGAVQRGAFADAVTSFFKSKTGSLTVLGGIRPREAAFLPAEFVGQVPDFAEINWHGQKKPVLIWFQDLGDRVKLIVEVGPMANKEARGKLVQDLKGVFGTLGKNKIKDSFTRCWSKTSKIDEDDQQDQNIMYKKIDGLWNDLNSLIEKKSGILQEIFQ